MLNKPHVLLLIILLACDEPYVDAPGITRPLVEDSPPRPSTIKFFAALDPASRLDPDHLSMARLRLQVQDGEGQIVIWNDGWFSNASTHDGTWVSGSVSVWSCDSVRFVVTDNPNYWRRPEDRKRFKFRFSINQDGYPKTEYTGVGYDGFTYVLEKPDPTTAAKILAGG